VKLVRSEPAIQIFDQALYKLVSETLFNFSNTNYTYGFSQNKKIQPAEVYISGWLFGSANHGTAAKSKYFHNSCRSTNSAHGPDNNKTFYAVKAKKMISIIIPTLNEGKYLPKLLASIKKQTYKDFEVIVSDANSSDSTVKTAKKYKCKIVKGGPPNKGRNRGADITKGKYLIFLDADVILPETFFEDMLEEFQTRKLDIATCRARPITKKLADKFVWAFANSMLVFLEKIKLAYGAGWFTMIKKDLHTKIHGYDETIMLAGDVEFIQRAARNGKFGVLRKNRPQISIRRFETEGRLNLIAKYIKITYYILTKKWIRSEKLSKKIDYKFGHYEK
jgi:glycosyltransferase involved in cell wall biosynthesis